MAFVPVASRGFPSVASLLPSFGLRSRGFLWLLMASRGCPWLSVTSRGCRGLPLLSVAALPVASRGLLWLPVASRGFRPMRPTWSLPLLAFACAPGSGEDPLDFTLRLRPVTPLNQSDLFDDVDRFTITVERGGGSVEVYELGVPGSDGT